MLSRPSTRFASRTAAAWLFPCLGPERQAKSLDPGNIDLLMSLLFSGDVRPTSRTVEIEPAAFSGSSSMPWEVCMPVVAALAASCRDKVRYQPWLFTSVNVISVLNAA